MTDGRAPHAAVVACGDHQLDLTTPQVMAVLNVTPDSFSDGGQHLDRESALERAAEMVAHGAAIIDVGGESTRPGAVPVTVDEEIQRVIPVIRRITDELPVVVSIDSSKPEVMRAAVDAGARMINDVNALRADGALDAAKQCQVPVVLMHMRGEPRTMQADPVYDDVVAEVRDFLLERVAACTDAGIPQQQLLIDPGFGFGKTVDHNLLLLKHLDQLVASGYPVLVGMSRKSMLAAVLDREVDDRLAGGLSVAALSVWLGAAIVRTHDVRATGDAIRIAAAVRHVKG